MAADGVSQVDNHLPGLRRWTDGFTLVNSNEFTTWETNVWQTILYAALYDDNLPDLGTNHSTSALNIQLESYYTGIADTSTYLKFQASFPGVDTLYIDVAGINDTIKDTILPNVDQTEYTVDITSLPDGTYFLSTNGFSFGTLTKDE